MANAKRLASGNYRCLVYSHTDENGKRHYESFTATTKAQAEQMASKFASNRDRFRVQDLTVKEAVQQYIDANEAVLSPATVAGYISDFKRMAPIYNLRIRKINSNDVQVFISKLSESYSPKTVKNTYGTLHKALKFFDPDIRFVVKLPKQTRKVSYAPDENDIRRLFENAPRKLQISILLAASHSFRRGEIAALKFSDIEGNRLHVHADFVQDKHNRWIYKDYPKTDQSDRYAILSDEVLSFIGNGNPDDFIVGWKPGTIDKRFYDLKKELGIEIRFHELRHYFASLCLILGVPDIYTGSLGGWRPDGSVMKNTYQNKFANIEEGYAKKINDHVLSVCNMKCNTAK
jgi:integrase